MKTVPRFSLLKKKIKKLHAALQRKVAGSVDMSLSLLLTFHLVLKYRVKHFHRI